MINPFAKYFDIGPRQDLIHVHMGGDVPTAGEVLRCDAPGITHGVLVLMSWTGERDPVAIPKMLASGYTLFHEEVTFNPAKAEAEFREASRDPEFVMIGETISTKLKRHLKTYPESAGWGETPTAHEPTDEVLIKHGLRTPKFHKHLNRNGIPGKRGKGR